MSDADRVTELEAALGALLDPLRVYVGLAVPTAWETEKFYAVEQRVATAMFRAREALEAA